MYSNLQIIFLEVGIAQWITNLLPRVKITAPEFFHNKLSMLPSSALLGVRADNAKTLNPSSTSQWQDVLQKSLTFFADIFSKLLKTVTVTVDKIQ